MYLFNYMIILDYIRTKKDLDYLLLLYKLNIFIIYYYHYNYFFILMFYCFFSKKNTINYINNNELYHH